MSYRLLAIGPATMYIGNKLYQVNAGDRLHLPDQQAQYILSGPYASSFIATDIEDPTEPEDVTSEGGFFSSTLLAETIPSSEDSLYVPPAYAENYDIQSMPGTPDQSLDPFQAAYDEYSEGISLPEAKEPKPQAKKKPTSKETAQVE